MTAAEIRHITLQEQLAEPDLPEVDEDAHLHDYEYDAVIYAAEEHYSDEYNELRELGLSHKQALMVINNE